MRISGKWGTLHVCAGSGRVLDYHEQGTLDHQPPTNRGYANIGKVDLARWQAALPLRSSLPSNLYIAECGVWLANGDYLQPGETQ